MKSYLLAVLYSIIHMVCTSPTDYKYIKQQNTAFVDSTQKPSAENVAQTADDIRSVVDCMKMGAEADNTLSFVYNKNTLKCRLYTTDVCTESLGTGDSAAVVTRREQEYKDVTLNHVLEPGVSCNASSINIYSPDESCDKAFDGILSQGSGTSWSANTGQGIGSWIQITLPEQRLVSKLGVAYKCGKAQQFKTTDIQYSDGSTQTVHRVCKEASIVVLCYNQPMEFHSVNPIWTSDVKITCAALCVEDVTYVSMGLREVWLLGPEP